MTLGIVLAYLFVGCQGQDVSGLFHRKSNIRTSDQAQVPLPTVDRAKAKSLKSSNGDKPLDFSPSNTGMSSRGLQQATIKNHLRGQGAQDIIVPSSISQPEPIPLSPTTSGHNLSNEISQSSNSRRRRLTPIYCDSVDSGICSTNSIITLTTEGIFKPSSLLFNGAFVGSSVRSLVIQSTVECTGVLCKMTFQDFDLLQISGSGSLLGSDIRLDVNILHILQGGKVSGTARGHPDGQGPSPGFNSMFSTFGASHGGKGGYWYLPNNEIGAYPGEVYGLKTLPADYGSGGTDSSGGGRISINATVKVEVDGTISEEGGGCIATSWCGSASGGSIYIASEEVLGTGRISADGGALALSIIDSVASGGGGRIAIYTNKESLGLTISASGGSLNSNPLSLHTQGVTGTIFRDKFQGNTKLPPLPTTTNVSACKRNLHCNFHHFISLITSSY